MLCRSSTTNRPSIARPICASDGATAFGKMYFSMNGVPWRRLRLFAIVWTQRDAVGREAAVDRPPSCRGGSSGRRAPSCRSTPRGRTCRRRRGSRRAGARPAAACHSSLPSETWSLDERHAEHRAAVLLGRPAREPAPAAAEVEHAHAGLEADLAAHEIELGSCASSSVFACLPVRARVDHALVEHRACRGRCRCRSAPRPMRPSASWPAG